MPLKNAAQNKLGCPVLVLDLTSRLSEQRARIAVWFHQGRVKLDFDAGLVSEGGSARLTISGPAAAAGSLRIAHGRATGMLGGKRVSGRIRSLSEPAFAVVSRHLAR